MSKLRNSYPEGNACVLLFSSCLSNDGRICTWSVGRLFVLPVVRVETSWWFNGEASAFRVNLFQLLYSAVGRLEAFIVEAFRAKPSEWLPSLLFIGGYLSLQATKMNSTNVESERYSDYFNPMPDISNNNFSKKLKPDNMIGTLGWSEF